MFFLIESENNIETVKYKRSYSTNKSAFLSAYSYSEESLRGQNYILMKKTATVHLKLLTLLVGNLAYQRHDSSNH